MPRYFFDLHDDLDVTDVVGQELADLNAARDQAASALADVARDELPGSGMQKTFTVDVRDETGSVVLTASLSFQAEQTG